MIYNEAELKREILILNAIVKAQTAYISDFKLKLEVEYQRGRDSILSRTCKSCKHKYIVDSMTTECRDNDSPIDYLDLECFPEFSCNKWEQK